MTIYRSVGHECYPCMAWLSSWCSRQLVTSCCSICLPRFMTTCCSYHAVHHPLCAHQDQVTLLLRFQEPYQEALKSSATCPPEACFSASCHLQCWPTCSASTCAHRAPTVPGRGPDVGGAQALPCRASAGDKRAMAGGRVRGMAMAGRAW